MTDLTPHGMGMKFDGTITLGSVITFLTVIIGLSVGWTQMQAQAAETERRVQRIEDQSSSVITIIEGNRRDVEQRVRSNELTIAGQSADLRNIQGGINEIKAAVMRLKSEVPEL